MGKPVADPASFEAIGALIRGYELGIERLDQTLGEFNAREIRCLGETFDPRRMNAIDREESAAVPEGTVLEVYRRGYEWNGEVFRPAQVKVSTVGGIVTGFRGALGVAQALLQDGKSPELGALRRELGTHWLIRRALHHFQQKDYSQLVDLLDASTRQSLGEINRDESARLLWNVVRRQPRLVLLGLRGLLMGKAERSIQV